MEYVIILWLMDLSITLSNIANNIAVLALIGAGIGGLIRALGDEEHEIAMGRKMAKVGLRVMCVSLALMVIIPKEDTQKLMVAVYLGDQLVNTEQFQETSGKAYDLLQNWLDEQLEETEE